MIIEKEKLAWEVPRFYIDGETEEFHDGGWDAAQPTDWTYQLEENGHEQKNMGKANPRSRPIQ